MNPTRYSKYDYDLLQLYLSTRTTKSTTTTVIQTSGGTLVATQEGYLPFLQQWVAFHPDCLGNILSFKDVLESHQVTMNSRQSRSFTVHCLRKKRKKPKKVLFRPSSTGLFFFDASADLTSTFPRFSTNRKECELKLQKNFCRRHYKCYCRGEFSGLLRTPKNSN